jgi:(1->4)-alpha-D-glucan 1-alpha-D-glucosylmutase
VRTEVATYRLQLFCEFTLDDAAGIADYLAQLGITHLYSSPMLQAVKGSTHGYDVLDHSRVNEELGGEAAFERLSQALRTHNLGLLLDIVPNHMAITGKDNVWWWDVLENGQASRYAPYFDVEWMPPESKLHHVVLLPVLGDHYGRILHAGLIHIERHDGVFTVHYEDHVFPLAPRSLPGILARAASGVASDDLAFFADALQRLPSSWSTDWTSLRRRHRDKGILLKLLTRFLQEDSSAAAHVDRIIETINQDHTALHELLERQNYRLAFWRTAGQDLGYRRFFDINTLIGLRTEHEQVFADIHDLIFRWLGSNRNVDGVRIDHPDGLSDPEEYLIRLRERVPSGWIVVEKILMPDEHLRASWPVSGTTGYDFLNVVNGLFIDRDSEEELTRFYGEFTGETRDFPEILREKKRQILQQVLGSDLNLMTSMLSQICERHPEHRDYTRHELNEALKEVMVEFPVYRTYARPRINLISGEDGRVVTQTIQSVSARRPDIGTDLLGFIRDILLLKIPGDLESDFVSRFQQGTGPLMAKGAEDTAFYCYHRCLALNEVGGDPARYGATVDQFHTWCQYVQRHWPKTMLATSTHDTKRGEDMRARLLVLSEMPARWMEKVSAWSAGHIQCWETHPPDHNLEYFLYQTLVGAWPLEEDRAWQYCEKAMREAKVHTSWTHPQKDYEESIRSFLRSLYADDVFVQELDRFVERLEQAGYRTSLSQTLIKLTAPGIPDFYQGAELWNFSLVDPDNRRPVNYSARRRLMQEMPGLSLEAMWQRRQEGLPKLWLIQRGLRVRHERPQAFGPMGEYVPLYAKGEKSESVVSFMRGGEVITIAPRLFLGLEEGWHDTIIDLPPGRWRQELDGQVYNGGPCRIGDVLRAFPVGLMCKVDSL